MAAASIHRTYYYVPKLFNVYSLLQLRGEFESHGHALFGALFGALAYKIRFNEQTKRYFYRCYASFAYISIISLYTGYLNKYPKRDNNYMGPVPFMLKK